MVERTATFEIESKSDARTLSRALEELHNRFREEGLGVREEKTERNEMIAEFKSLHDEVDADSTGKLVVTYTDENADDSS